MAKLLVVLLTVGGIGWTCYARCCLGERYTTSQTMRRAFDACPQIGILAVLLAVNIAQDAFPEANRWLTLTLFVGAYAMGHALWGY